MIPESYINEILARVSANRRVRRELPTGGRLYLDRRLPFLCLYRRKPGTIDAAAEQLITTQTAFIIMPGEKASSRDAGQLLRQLVAAQSEYFEGFLILEVWFTSPDEQEIEVHEESGEPLPPVPTFRIHTDIRYQPTQVVQTLVRSLGKIRLFKKAARVEWISGKGIHPPGHRSLLTPKEIRELGCHVVGIEVSPIFRDPTDGEIFPNVLGSLRRSLGRAFRQAFYAYVRQETNLNLHHYHMLGRRSFVKAVWEVDRQLAAVGSSFDLLLQATPTNTEAAWLEFRQRGFEVAPKFQYRPLTVDTSELKRQLFQIPIERIEDATLAHLFQEKQDELDRKITMLGDVGTSRFLHGSIQVHGSVTPRLAELATDLIRRPRVRFRKGGFDQNVGAEEFCRLAEAEVQRYQAVDSTFRPNVQVRDDLYAGLLVSQGELLIGKKSRFPASRVEALLQHEVGTHLLTYHNGNCQPFRQLALGLAGYDSLQEGLAVLAEYLVGGLNHTRLRLLAARVLAVKALIEGAGFVETFRDLVQQVGLGKRVAYTIAMRVHRAGGLTKDAVYLQGLVEILRYLKNGGRLEPLLVGKIAVDHLPFIEELQLRNILHPPPLQPHYLNHPYYNEKIVRICSGMSVLDLTRKEN
ncbi:MAG: DUF1704 domain-containing protein [Planctomycetia bacterium]|jgi:uncharacterized protein (TIGR02421 family)